MKSRRIFYTLSFGIIMLMAAVICFLPDGLIPSLWGGSALGGLTAEEITGDVSIRRGGSTYTLKEGLELQEGDEILAGRRASCRISQGDVFGVSLDRDAILSITSVGAEGITLEVEEGAVFVDVLPSGRPGGLRLVSGELVTEPEPGCALSLEAYSGTQTLNVYAGQARVHTAGGQTEALQEEGLVGEAQQLVVLEQEDGLSVGQSETPVSELRNFLLQELLARDGLCFEPSILRNVLAERGADTDRAQAESRPEERMTCSLEIVCQTVTDRVGQAGVGFPEDGVIFPASQVKFSRGETVFDVLQRNCRTAGIPLDYSYTVAHSGYYVKEIAGLRELAFGPESGWQYRVNGWYPNYGASRYEIEEGDVIVWAYSCDGGADLGREDWKNQG